MPRVIGWRSVPGVVILVQTAVLIALSLHTSPIRTNSGHGFDGVESRPRRSRRWFAPKMAVPDLVVWTSVGIAASAAALGICRLRIVRRRR